MSTKKLLLIRTFVLATIAMLCNVSGSASDGLTDCRGIANKNHVCRIMHDSDNLYVSSLGAGVTPRNSRKIIVK